MAGKQVNKMSRGAYRAEHLLGLIKGLSRLSAPQDRGRSSTIMFTDHARIFQRTKHIRSAKIRYVCAKYRRR